MNSHQRRKRRRARPSPAKGKPPVVNEVNAVLDGKGKLVFRESKPAEIPARSAAYAAAIAGLCGKKEQKHAN